MQVVQAPMQNIDKFISLVAAYAASVQKNRMNNSEK